MSIIDAKDAGCKIDGVTDDTEALTAAANQAVASGKALHIPAGVCIIDNAMLPSGLTMFGDGIGVTTFRRSPAAAANTQVVPVISFVNGTAIRLSKFSIDGNKAQQNNDSAQSANLQFVTCSNFHAREIASHDSTHWGIMVVGATASEVGYCVCYGNGLGIWILGAVSDLTVSHNVVYGNSAGGIWFYAPDGAASSMTDIVCNANRLDDNGAQGIVLSGRLWFGLGAAFDFDSGLGILQIDRFECSWNVVRRSGTYGIMIAATHGRVEGNRCYDNGHGDWAGINCTSEFTLFKNNECNNNGGFGIDAGGCFFCNFEGNICRDNGVTPHPISPPFKGYGLNLGGARNCSAIGNVLENNGNSVNGGIQLSLLRFEMAGKGTLTFPFNAQNCFIIDNEMWVPPNCIGIHVGHDPWGIQVAGNRARNVTGSNAFVIESASGGMARNLDDASLVSPRSIRTIATHNNVVVIPPHVDKFTLVSGNSTSIGDIYTDWTLASYRKVYAVRVTTRGSGYTDPEDGPKVTFSPSGAVVGAATDHVDGVVAQCIVYGSSEYSVTPSVDIASPPSPGVTATAVAYVSGLGPSTQNAQIDGMTLAIQMRLDNPLVFGSNAGVLLEGGVNATFKTGDYLFLEGRNSRWVETARLVDGDGTLLQDENGAIYVLYGGAKFHVRDRDTCDRLFPGRALRALSSKAVAGIATTPGDGTLLREESAIWVIFGGAKFQIPDTRTCERLFAGSVIHQVWDGALSDIGARPLYDMLLREENDTISAIFGGAKFQIPDMETYRRLFSSLPIHQVWDGALNNIPRAPVDGTALREENGRAWVVYGGAKFQVPDEATWDHLFAGGTPRQLWDDALATLGSIPVDGTLLREEFDSQVYVVSGGHKKPAPPGRSGTVHLLWKGALAQLRNPTPFLSLLLLS